MLNHLNIFIRWQPGSPYYLSDKFYLLFSAFVDFQCLSPRNSLEWDRETGASQLYEIKERVYTDQNTIISNHRKEIAELKCQLQNNNLQMLKMLDSETEMSARSMTDQNVELENATLKLKLAEMVVIQERNEELRKSNLDEMQVNYGQALEAIGKEGEAKTRHILILEDQVAEKEQELQSSQKKLMDRDEEIRVLQSQITNLHSNILKQSQVNSSSHAQSETKWLHHIEKQNTAIMGLQEQAKMDERKITGAFTEMKQLKYDKNFLRTKIETIQTQLTETETELAAANTRTEKELTAMRQRHKEKYGQSLRSINDENINLKAKLTAYENEQKRLEKILEELKMELELTKVAKASGEQPYLIENLYTKIRECIIEFQNIFCYLPELGNDSNSSPNTSSDYTLQIWHTNPEDRIKQLTKIQTRMKQYREYLEERFLTDMSQECKIQ